MNNQLIYGKNPLEGVVSVEPGEGEAEIFLNSGEVRRIPHQYWILYPERYSHKFQRLRDDQYFKYLVSYPDKQDYERVIRNSYRKRYDFYTARDPKTNFMIRSGVTYFKGLKVSDVSVLSFDLETTGLNPNAPDAEVLLIANTFRDSNGIEVRKLFSRDDYSSDKPMIQAWCRWVREINPAIVIGHYIYGFDFPYLHARSGGKLPLGRRGEDLQIEERVRQFRRDGSQSYDFRNVQIYGREVIDTKFLAIKYDVTRKFPNYSLKPIINYLGQEKKDRTFVDASRMKELWQDSAMREKIKAYALDDSDDALKLYDLMIPSYFYYTQSIPMSLQEVINSATGGQINAFMVRSYLQNNQSIPKASPNYHYPGAISIGVPGIHKNALKLDIKSNYPHIMLQYDIFPYDKDPKGYMRESLEYFLSERLRNKELFKQTKDPHFEDLSNAGKIIVNSYYGFMGAPGANFNYPAGAAQVTACGRDILRSAIYWATGKEAPGGISEDSSDTDS